jgi:LEA14-like dessication related protein
LLLSTLSALLACCAALTLGTSPSVTISELTVASASVLERQYDVTLRIQNPNPSAPDIDGVVFEVELNGHPFAKGVGGQSVTVPRFGSEFMRVEAISTLAGILKQIGELSSGQQSSLRYPN